jgi:acyl dehydratase
MGGLQYASGVNDGTLLALLQVDKWRMLLPVKHGDTLHAEATVIDRKESSKPDRGIVKMDRKFVRQDREVVQQMEATLLYRRRP